MTIAVYEKYDSRDTTIGDESESVELKFVIRGTDDDIAARSALLAASPVLYANLIRQTAQITPIGYLVWEGTVRYGRRKPPETGDSSYQFDTTGGTLHITQSLQTMARYAPPGKTAPNYFGAIGVSGDNVEGVDITIPVNSFSETHYLPVSFVTEAYKTTVEYLTGTVNAMPFRGKAAGEVLFLGASGSQRGQEDWEITFKFSVSRNRTGITIGDITGIAKMGWDYLWVKYEDAEDAAAGALIKKPVAVYVEKVYPDGDFTLLGIGT